LEEIIINLQDENINLKKKIKEVENENLYFKVKMADQGMYEFPEDEE